MRENVRKLVESKAFQAAILAVIVINAVVIGVQTMQLPDETARTLQVIDAICLGIYIVEAALKIFAWRGAYFRDGWNIFDFVVIVACCVPENIIPFPAAVARILRVFRVFRVFRLVSAFKQMRIIIEAIIRSLPGVAWTGFLLIIIFYVYAIIGVNMYGEAFPDRFGDLGGAFFTLFQVMTLEGWADAVARPIMEVSSGAWLYFVSFVILAAIIIFNVVVGIIVNVIDETNAAEAAKARAERAQAAGVEAPSIEDQLAEELAAAKEHLKNIEHLLKE